MYSTPANRPTAVALMIDATYVQAVDAQQESAVYFQAEILVKETRPLQTTHLAHIKDLLQSP